MHFFTRFIKRNSKLNPVIVTGLIGLFGIAALTPNNALGNAQDHLQTLVAAKVLRVIDGDTVQIQTEQNTFLADLAFIDAPENEQPFGRKSKAYLSSLLATKSVLIQAQDEAWVLYRGAENVNLHLLRQGYVWPSQAVIKNAGSQGIPAKDNGMREYISTYQHASESSKGLWALEHELRVSPWQWRKQTVEITPRKEYKLNLTNPLIPEPSQRSNKQMEEKEQILREISKLKAIQEKQRHGEINRHKTPSHVTTKPNESKKHDQHH